MDGRERVGLTTNDQCRSSERHVCIALLDQRVRATAARDRVVAGSASNGVVTARANDRIVSGTTVDRSHSDPNRNARQRPGTAGQTRADQTQSDSRQRAVRGRDRDRRRTTGGVGQNDPRPASVKRRRQLGICFSESVKHFVEGQDVTEFHADPRSVA